MDGVRQDGDPRLQDTEPMSDVKQASAPAADDLQMDETCRHRPAPKLRLTLEALQARMTEMIAQPDGGPRASGHQPAVARSEITHQFIHGKAVGEVTLGNVVYLRRRKRLLRPLPLPGAHASVGSTASLIISKEAAEFWRPRGH